MRIHIPLQTKHFAAGSIAAAGSSTLRSTPPLVHIGGDLVLVELQGELSWEGQKDDGVIGVIGLDRHDKPTLHLGQHHLLHGKMANLPKPYAVIRRVVGPSYTSGERGTELDGDAMEEESSSSSSSDEEEEALFAPNPDIFPITPKTSRKGKEKSVEPSSSPYYPPSTPMDYSSDLEMSSPLREDRFLSSQRSDRDEEDEEEGRGAKRARVDQDEVEKKAKGRAKKERQRRLGRERTRHYEVVGVVRKKVVFALRPEPLVAPTILPE